MAHEELDLIVPFVLLLDCFLELLSELLVRFLESHARFLEVFELRLARKIRKLAFWGDWSEWQT